MTKSDADTRWFDTLLDDVLGGRPTTIPVAIAVYHAKTIPHAGLPWVRRLAQSSTATDHARAAACHCLAVEGEAPPLDAVRSLLFAESDWARFHAALASHGPWATPLTNELERALLDDAVLSDMDHVYRVCDVAALALSKVDRPPASEALRNWYSCARAELTGADATRRDLATYALAELGDSDALAQLESLAAESDFQAQRIQERLASKRTA